MRTACFGTFDLLHYKSEVPFYIVAFQAREINKKYRCAQSFGGSTDPFNFFTQSANLMILSAVASRNDTMASS